MNKRMRPRAAQQYVTRVARKHGYSVVQLPGRGKGSHAIFAVLDSDAKEIARFGLTGRGNRELSWAMMRQLEEGLAHLFGERWMER